jgi:hypothetical protein
MNTKASTPATAIAKAGAKPIRAGRDRRRHARFLSILMNRYFLIAVVIALGVVVLGAVGLAVFAPTPAQHHVETVLPNDRFQPPAH